MKDQFYPRNEGLAQGLSLGLHETVVDWLLQCAENLRLTSAGDKARESRLVNQLGQLRASVADFDSLPHSVQQMVRAVVLYLRSTGRIVDLGNQDARFWVTRRDGSPRW